MHREERLANPGNNPRLRAAQDHTWTWSDAPGAAPLAAVPTFDMLGPFAKVLQKERSKAVNKSPTAPTSNAGFGPGPNSRRPEPARRRDIQQVGKSSKEMDSLLLRTALDSHEAERGAATRVAAGRNKQRSSVETFADLRRSKDKDKEAGHAPVIGSSPRGQNRASARRDTNNTNHTGMGDAAHEPMDWRMRPANVDTAYIPGKVAPLGEYDATQRNPGMRAAGLSSVVHVSSTTKAAATADVSIPPLHNATDPFEAGLPRPVDTWGAVGLLQWAPIPSRMQPWPHLRDTPEPGSRLYRAQTTELQQVDILARSFQRAANMSTLMAETRAHMRAGIIQENLRQLPKAVERYTKFLGCALQLGDMEARAVAHNHLAVAHQKLADHLVASASYSSLPTAAQMNYEMALEHHLKHLEVADSVGQFVAHTNLGLMSASLGQKKAASYSYEQAIKCTVQINDQSAEQSAVGNMAFLLLGEQRWDQCRPFLERYVALCCGLDDRLGQAQGHLALGRAARALGELTAAAASFDSSLHAAQACGDQALFNDAKVLLGITRGELRFVEMTTSNQLPLGLQQRASPTALQALQ